jgi:uncharacterized protein involved in exopolysaccharide biosynthesis
MEDETNLRDYIHILLRHWRVIAAATLLAGVVALAVTSTFPARYRATAVVLITRALYEIQFSPEIPNLSEASSMQQLLTGNAALELATSDAVVQKVLLQVRDVLPADERNLFTLRKILEADTGGNPSIVNLRATSDNAQYAADIANAWASVYVGHLNDIYLQPGDQLTFFEGQLAQARDNLDEADQAITEFQKRNDSAILQAQLAAKQSALSEYLAMNESLIMLQQNVQDLQNQLARRPADAASSLGDDLAQLLLQVNAFSNQSSDLPFLLQVPGNGSLSDQTVGQQAAYLGELATTVESKQAEVKKQMEALPAEIKALQGQIQEKDIEATKLARQRDLADTVYMTLAQKAKETEISAQDSSRLVRLASTAVAPDRPMSRGRLMNTALGLMLGLIVSVVVVFAVEYLRKPAKESIDPRTEHQPSVEIA